MIRIRSRADQGRPLVEVDLGHFAIAVRRIGGLGHGAPGTDHRVGRGGLLSVTVGAALTMIGTAVEVVTAPKGSVAFAVRL